MKTETIKQIVKFYAWPHNVFEALMDSKKQSVFTNSDCNISREVGGKFSAYGGYIEGTNLEIVPDKKIVQSWHASDWPNGHLSKVTFLLSKTKTGTRLYFTQTGVPAGFFKEISAGWHEHYWNKMKVMLEKI